MAASNLSKTTSHLGDYTRKMRSRLGKKGAVVAGAHKLSRIIYTMIKNQAQYCPEVMHESQQKWKQRRIMSLEKQLQHLKAAS